MFIVGQSPHAKGENPRLAAFIFDAHTRQFETVDIDTISKEYLSVIAKLGLVSEEKIFLLGIYGSCSPEKESKCYHSVYSLVDKTFEAVKPFHPYDGASVLFIDAPYLLISGGDMKRYPFKVVKKNYLYNIQSGKMTRIADLNIARSGHSLIRLKSGKILIAGGTIELNRPPAHELELYDPKNNTVTLLGKTKVKNSSPVLAILKNGDILIFEGSSFTGDRHAIEKYTPATS